MTPDTLLQFGLTNALLATLLAAAAWLVTRRRRNPHVAAVLWLVVLLKLVTPPAVALPVAVVTDPVNPGERRASSPPSTSPTTGESPLDTLEEQPSPTDRPARDLAESPIEPPGERGASAPSSDEPASASPAPEAPASQPAIASRPAETGEPAADHGVDAPRSPRPADIAPTPSADTEHAAAPAAATARDRRPAAWPALVPAMLLTLWLAGTLLAACVTACRIVRFRRTLRQVAAADDQVQQTADSVARRLGLRGAPAVLVVPGSVGPMLWAGALRPLVLVPRPLWEVLDGAGRETLLAHELAHVVRRDHWVRRLEAAVLALYWWLPTVWLAVRQRERAAESCCDAAVLAAWPDRPRAYAEALFAAVSVLSTGRPPALASGLGRTSELKERLTMIVHEQVPKRPTRWGRLALFATACLVLAVSVRFVVAERAEEPKPVSPAAVPRLASSLSDGVADMTAGPAADEFAFESFEFGDPESGGSKGYGDGSFDPMGGHDSGGLRDPFRPYLGTRMDDMYGGAPRRAVSREVRARMVQSLIAVVENRDEPADVRLQALRALGRVGRDFEEAEQALRRQAERAETPQERLAAAEALESLGSPSVVDLLWEMFRAIEPGRDVLQRQVEILTRLDAAGAAPPAAQDAANVALVVAEGRAVLRDAGMPMMPGSPAGSMPGSLSRPPGLSISYGRDGRFPAERVLARLRESGEGVRRLVDTVGLAVEPEIDTEAGEDRYGTKTPVRDVLLREIAAVSPTSDEIALALVEALSSKDPGVRHAAARALGDGQARVADPRSGHGVPAIPFAPLPARPAPAADPEEAEPARPVPGAPPGAAADDPAPAPARLPRSARLSRPATRPGPEALSEEVRTKMVRSLIAAAENPDLPDEVRAEALRSLGTVGRGVAEAEEKLLTTAERAEGPQAKLAIGEALIAIGSPKGTELLWSLLETQDDAELVIEIAGKLDQAGAVPPTPEAVRRLTLIGALHRAPRPRGFANTRTLIPGGPTNLLVRLIQSGAGVRVLVETVSATDEPISDLPFNVEALSLRADGTPDDREAGRTERLYGTKTPIRDALLALLRQTRPVDDDVALALVEALSHEDPGISRAAAQALGNPATDGRRSFPPGSPGGTGTDQ